MSKKQVDLGPKRPIRVLRIIARMNVGGPAVQISGLMRGLNFNEFEQLLLTGHCDADESDFLMESATDVVATRIDGLGRSIKPWSDFSVLFEIIRAIRKFKPDVIHTHTAKAGVIGRIASILSIHPSKRVHTFHGHLLHGYFGRFKTRLVIVVEKVLALFSDQLLAVGKKVQDELLIAGIGQESKFTVIPPGVKIGFVPVSIIAKRELGLDSNLLYCSFIGRVTDIKRPDRFLDVVSTISKRDIQLRFLIAGEGNLLGEVRQRIEAESLPVTCLGWQTDIEKVIGASDIVVLTSDNEGTPLSLIQAGMAGVPVVSTNVGSVSEIAIDGVTGILTNLEVVAIANAIETLVNNPELRSNLGSEAKKFTLANFGVERLVKDHEDLYRRLIPNRAKF